MCALWKILTDPASIFDFSNWGWRLVKVCDTGICCLRVQTHKFDVHELRAQTEVFMLNTLSAQVFSETPVGVQTKHSVKKSPKKCYRPNMTAPQCRGRTGINTKLISWTYVITFTPPLWKKFLEQQMYRKEMKVEYEYNNLILLAKVHPNVDF